MKPKLFDTCANDFEPKEIVRPWKQIELDPEYAGAWFVAGDLDGDGEVEIASARNVNEDDNHYTCSVIAYRLDGSVLWRWGDPGIGRSARHHDVGCQIHDWDGDGEQEVIVAGDRVLIALSGSTGKEKWRFPIPQHASDCVTFADLSGMGRPSEVLVKTRYTQIWAFDIEGKELWTIQEPAGFKTAHQARPIDIDGDGRDEIFAGYALLEGDGRIRWDLSDSGIPLERGHLDCARLFHRAESPMDTRVLITCCGGDCIAMLDGNGRLVWSQRDHHFESIDIGKICSNVPGKQIVVDIDHRPWGEGPLWVLSERGEWLGQIMTDYCRHHFPIDWHGTGTESIMIGPTRCLFDESGQKTIQFETPDPPDYRSTTCFRGDLSGNGLPDLMLSGNPNTICIFKNPRSDDPQEKVPLGTEVNFTLY